MAYKIILSELEKSLFPECYPYCKAQLSKELELIKSIRFIDKLSLQNISYKIKLMNYCYTFRETNLRYIIYKLFNNHINHYLVWHQPYDWYQLKSILMFFIVCSSVKKESDLIKLVNEKPVSVIFSKYLPKNLKEGSK
jgi:hypothetical protein